MRDQAEKLRELVQEKEEEKGAIISKERIKFGRTIAITSGKGGVGKTNLATNLAICLSNFKKEVLILDADLGLANIDVILGLTPKYTLHHVIKGQKEINEILIDGPANIKIIPGASGIQELANLDSEQRTILLQKLSKLEEQFEIILIDTAAGLSQNVLSFCIASDEVFIITTPEPTAITDAYSMIKVISQENSDVNLRLIVNMVNNVQEATQVSERMRLVTKQFLSVAVEDFGYIFNDRNITKSVLAQKPFVLIYPYSPASICIRDLAARIINVEVEQKKPVFRGFFKKFVNLMKKT